MIHKPLVVAAERLRDDLAELHSNLHKKHEGASRQVISADLRASVTHLAETRMVNVAPRADVQGIVPAERPGNLNMDGRACAVRASKELILLRQVSVGSIGGIQGDCE
jgi:hypothetical protein